MSHLYSNYVGYRHKSVGAHFIIAFIREGFALCCTAKDVRNHLSIDFDFSAKKPSKNSKTSGRENEILTKPTLTLPFEGNTNPAHSDWVSDPFGTEENIMSWERNASVADPHTKQRLWLRHVRVVEGAKKRRMEQTSPPWVALLQETACHVSILIVKRDTYTITIMSQSEKVRIQDLANLASFKAYKTTGPNHKQHIK